MDIMYQQSSVHIRVVHQSDYFNLILKEMYNQKSYTPPHSIFTYPKLGACNSVVVVKERLAYKIIIMVLLITICYIFSPFIILYTNPAVSFSFE